MSRPCFIWSTQEDETSAHWIFGNGPLLTNDSVIAIADNCPHLVNFVCGNNEHITDVSMMQLAEKCKELIKVHLENLSKITDASLGQIWRLVPPS